ncbi:MAG TPA: hypothetical protein VLD67_02595 [Vicinamibacterales bacterium]|nr:hypothetical protein [Vicinamibacterales bacterium]
MSGIKIALGPENPEAGRHLPPDGEDGSGVGINYADAYIKAIKVTLDDGRKVAVRRKGLKLTFMIGDRSGEALLRRLDHGPDEKTIVHRAIEEAARNAGARFAVEGGVMVLEI